MKPGHKFWLCLCGMILNYDYFELRIAYFKPIIYLYGINYLKHGKMTTIETLQAKNTLNRSKLFKRAHYLTKFEGLSFGEALRRSHREIREYRANLDIQTEELCNKLKSAYNVQLHPDEMMKRAYYSNHKITA